jgi:hypothetical protein
MTEGEYLPFVRAHLSPYWYRIRASLADVDDLVGAGALALVKARARFNAERGVQFRTFAQHAIRGAILDELGRAARRQELVSLDALPQLRVAPIAERRLLLLEEVRRRRDVIAAPRRRCCASCGQVFQRRPKHSGVQWAAKATCGAPTCVARHRWARHRAAAVPSYTVHGG